MVFKKISYLCVVCTVKSSVFLRKLPLLYTVEQGKGLKVCWPKARTSQTSTARRRSELLGHSMEEMRQSCPREQSEGET